MKKLLKFYDKADAYLTKHPNYNAWVHLIGGIGLGILITYPIVGEHPIRWALSLLFLSVFLHLLPLVLPRR